MLPFVTLTWSKNMTAAFAVGLVLVVVLGLLIYSLILYKKKTKEYSSDLNYHYNRRYWWRVMTFYVLIASIILVVCGLLIAWSFFFVSLSD